MGAQSYPQCTDMVVRIGLVYLHSLVSQHLGKFFRARKTLFDYSKVFWAGCSLRDLDRNSSVVNYLSQTDSTGLYTAKVDWCHGIPYICGMCWVLSRSCYISFREKVRMSAANEKSLFSHVTITTFERGFTCFQKCEFISYSKYFLFF